MRMWWHAFIRVCWRAWIRIIRMIFMDIFSMHTPWNIFLRKPWVGNFYSAMVIFIKLAGMRPIPTSAITITIRTR